MVFRELGTAPILVAPRQLLSRCQQESVPSRQPPPCSHSQERPQQQQQTTPVSTLQTALGVLGSRALSASNSRSAVLRQMVLGMLSDKGPLNQRLPLRPGLTSCSRCWCAWGRPMQQGGASCSSATQTSHG